MISAGEFTEALAHFATGVTVVTVADGRDDIGSTITAFASISVEPPLVMVSITSTSYLAEVIDRRGRFAVNVLSARQKALAGRFAAAGRPSARLLLAAEPHQRGEHTGALVLTTAVAALECEVSQRVVAGDHTIYLASVLALPPVTGGADGPLIRYTSRYRTLG
ncbi:flavin reductase family protein [Thermobifida fusca]|uniref:Reductase n=1 Tax=Thermobifida fusca TM51 TaxID=1169414 RepID=A0A9P2TDJ7_THEFU|nr:flavin reductase family protein [Thermobifida fusca]EOR72351.1 reductase [Thermobifida fusca TM51]